MSNEERLNYLNIKIDNLIKLMKEFLDYEYKELLIKENKISYLSYENIFMQKIFLNANTFLNLSRNKTSFVGYEKRVLDIHSLNIILRNIMETSVLYRNIYKEKEENVKELKFLIWKYRSLFKVTRGNYKNKNKKIYSENIVYEQEVRRQIEESLLYQKLKNKKEIFDNKKNRGSYLCDIKSSQIIFFTISEKINQYYNKFKEGELLYGYFSQYTHPSYQSFNELGTSHSESIESDWYNILLSSCNSLMFTLCYFLFDYTDNKNLDFVSNKLLLEEIKEFSTKTYL